MTLKLNSKIVLKYSSDEVLNQCINENTFVNPLYVNNEENGRSNWNTERFITTYRQEGDSIVLPRGYIRDLLKILKEQNITPEMIDERVCCPCNYPKQLNEVVLRPYQLRAIDEAMKFDQGSIISPTGSGKSLIGLEIIRRMGQKALIIVHRGELAKQWLHVIEERLGIKAGFIGDGEWNIGEEITVSMVQTLASRESDLKRLSVDTGLVLIDEVHHTPASTFFDVIGNLNAKYRYGLSASPNRRDGLETIIYRAIGPAIETISRDEVEELGATVPATVVQIQTGFNPGLVNSWSEYLDTLTASTERNVRITDLARTSEGSTLILVDRVTHAEKLSDMLNRRSVDHVLAHGKINKKEREGIMDRIKSAKLTVGTTSLLGEGLDVSSWDTLIMGAPISSEIKLMQAIGRIVRPSNGKEKAVVYDLKDECGFAGSSFNKRFEIYKKNKIWVQFKK